MRPRGANARTCGSDPRLQREEDRMPVQAHVPLAT